MTKSAERQSGEGARPDARTLPDKISGDHCQALLRAHHQGAAMARCRRWRQPRRGGARSCRIPNYVGADAKVIAASMTGKFTFEPGDTRARRRLQHLLRQIRRLPVLFGRDLVPHADAPLGPDCRRQARSVVFRHRQGGLSARSLPRGSEEAGRSRIDPGRQRPRNRWFPRGEQSGFIDGITYDGKQPNAYLAKFKIGLKQGQKVTAAGISGS